MSGFNSLNGQIQNGRSKMFRRLYIKRRVLGSGLYESDWVQISEDVIKWGTIKKEIDATKVNSFKFSSFSMTVSNQDGLYNPHDDENSLWYGYGDQQRTLVKIVAGFQSETLGADGVWTVAEYPGSSLWDAGTWDAGDVWDGDSTTFCGFIWGDINIAGTNQVMLPIVPLTQCFKQFAATNIVGYNNSITASQFMTTLRDQVDVAGAYIFRPFFGDTSTGFDINSTTVQYTNLDSATAADVADSTVWEVIEQLAGSENMLPYSTNDGVFKFTTRNFDNTTSVFSFFGPGGFSSEYGTTIKAIKYYGFRVSKYYSRVRVQFAQDDTTTSYGIVDSDYRVRGDSSPWTLGERTLDIQNFWIPTQLVAEEIAQQLFDEYSAAKKEIEFSTSFIPHLELNQRIDVTYDSSQPAAQSMWDLFNWADHDDTTAPTSDDLIFDSGAGDALNLVAKEFRLISISLSLDNGECTYIGRE